MDAVRRRPKTVVTGAVIGVLALAGAAVAAILLTSNLSGSVSAATKTASDKLLAPAIIDESDAVECSAELVDEDEVQVNPTLYTIEAEEGAQNAPIEEGGSCTVKLRLHNDGDVPLYIDGYSGDLPEGWTANASNVPSAGTEIAPGHTVSTELTFHASEGASGGGEISGSVTTSTSPPGEG